jgi:glycosyltransferase involved in cell wall biosynthesis
MTEPASRQPAAIYVDHTHLGRHVTGLERITLELFSPDSLAPLHLTPLRAGGTADLILRQQVSLPLQLLRERRSLMLCPGFPPSLPLQRFSRRVIPYIHDLFLLTRRADLNPRAKLYMAPAFRRAVASLPLFLVNSAYTRDELRRFCREEADVLLYRPGVRNVFGVDAGDRLDGAPRAEGPLRLVALGTVEPRKNLPAAAAILTALRERGQTGARLDVVGRIGWGDETAKLQATPGVTLHGYLPIEATRELLRRADLFINTSHDEGLGLPLLEAQYAGLPVIAPDGRVFREVLGDSGLLVDPSQAKQAATQIEALLAQDGWRKDYAGRAAANLARWNGAVAADRDALVDRLQQLLHDLQPADPSLQPHRASPVR